MRCCICGARCTRQLAPACSSSARALPPRPRSRRSGANLEGVTLFGALATGADFTGANLRVHATAGTSLCMLGPPADSLMRQLAGALAACRSRRLEQRPQQRHVSAAASHGTSPAGVLPCCKSAQTHTLPLPCPATLRLLRRRVPTWSCVCWRGPT